MNGSRTPPAPKELDDVGKALWKHVHSNWDMSPSDAPLIRGLCQVYARAASAAEVLNREGSVTTDRFGQPREHPAVAIEQKCWASTVKIWRELGLSDAPPEVRGPKTRGYR